ncbi:TPA: hypothetical protein ACHKE6_005250, partial [Escherichia coli]
MDEKQLQALANELAKNLKTPEDLSQFDRLLKKLSVEAALNAEMTHHLGYEKNLNRPDFPGECFICELRLPDHCFRWKHNTLFCFCRRDMTQPSQQSSIVIP